jgi:Phage integrase, N-terminal SAM-like domain
MGALRDRMIEEMKLRNFSAATQKTYLYAVTRLAKYYVKAPDQLTEEDIRAFLLHLLVERKLSPNGLTGYCSGLRFFYNETLRWDENKLFIPPRSNYQLSCRFSLFMSNLTVFAAACLIGLMLLVGGAADLRADPILEVIDIRPILARHEIGNALGLAFDPDSNVIYLAHGSDPSGGFIYTLDIHGSLLHELDLQSATNPELSRNP